MPNPLNSIPANQIARMEPKQMDMTVKLILHDEYSDGGVREILSALVTTHVIQGWELVSLESRKEPIW